MRIGMKSITAICAAVAIAFSSIAVAQEDAQKTLFTNVNVFDGFGPELQMGMNVLVEGNHISQVSAEPISVDGAIVIDGNGRTMTPGFIDMHQHVMLNPPEGTARPTRPAGTTQLVAPSRSII